MNRVNYYPTALTGVERKSESAFIKNSSDCSAFSFRDVLDVFKKKKDTGVSETNQSSSTTSKEGGSGIGAGLAAGLAGLLGVAGAVAPVLPAIGVGSKSRIAETNATSEATAKLYNAQTDLIQAQQKGEKEKEKLFLIIGVIVFLIVIVAGVLFTRK